MASAATRGVGARIADQLQGRRLTERLARPMQEDHSEKRRRRPRILGLSRRRPTLMAAPEDSAQGCRERAEADLRRADDDIPINARQVLQASARHWLARAELLERLETSFAARSSHGPDQADDT